MAFHGEFRRSSKLFKYSITNIADGSDDGAMADAISEPADATTIPSSARLIPIAQHGWIGVKIIPFGTDTDGDEFRMYVQNVFQLGRRQLRESPFTQDWTAAGVTIPEHQWLRHNIMYADCLIASGAPGFADGYVINTEYFCDAIAVTTSAYGTALEAERGVSDVVYDPGADVIAASWCMPDLGSPDYIYIGFDLDGGSGTAAATANCLVQLLA